MSINLNDDSFNGKEGKTPFNKGIGGIVENVLVTVEKTKAEEKAKEDPNKPLPEYKLVFTDSEGGSTNEGFYQITKEVEYNGKTTTIAEQVKKRGIYFKHILHAMYGSDYVIPSFSTAEEMLHVTMKLIAEASKSRHLFRVMSNIDNKGYIKVRKWSPCMEPMSVPLEETRLKPSNIENYTKVTPDKPKTATASADSLLDTDDDWNN